MIRVNGVDCWPSRGAATILKIGRNTMFQELRKRGVLSKDNTPTSAYSTKGYFKVAQNSRGRGLTTYITPDGLEFLKIFLSDMPRKVEKPYVCPDLPVNLLGDE